MHSRLTGSTTCWWGRSPRWTEPGPPWGTFTGGLQALPQRLQNTRLQPEKPPSPWRPDSRHLLQKAGWPRCFPLSPLWVLECYSVRLLVPQGRDSTLPTKIRVFSNPTSCPHPLTFTVTMTLKKVTFSRVKSFPHLLLKGGKKEKRKKFQHCCQTEQILT